MEENNIKYCSKCGATNNINSLYCSSCGESFSNDTSKKKKSFEKIIPIIIVALFALVLVFNEISVSKQNKEIDFYNTCIDASNEMLEGAKLAETSCNEIVKIWKNSIWKTDDISTNAYTLDDNGYFFEDFNDALSKYVSSSRNKTQINKISTSMNKVASYMETLRNNKVEKYERLYEDIEELYDIYLKFMNMPIYMNGSLNSFSEDFGDVDDAFSVQYHKVCSYYN